MLNSRRSSIEPSKLHKLAFLHDNLDYVIITIVLDCECVTVDWPLVTAIIRPTVGVGLTI
jgi:hypothetical protein